MPNENSTLSALLDQDSSTLDTLLKKVTRKEDKLKKQLKELHNQFQALQLEADQSKLPMFLRFGLKDATKIQTCETATVALVEALKAYKEAILAGNTDIKEVSLTLKTAKDDFNNAIIQLPSNGKYKKLGLLMVGVGVLVTAVCSALFVLSGFVSGTVALLPIGAAGAAFSTLGACVGATMTGAGIFMFAKNSHTTGLEKLKDVKYAVESEMRALKEYSNESSRPKN